MLRILWKWILNAKNLSWSHFYHINISTKMDATWMEKNKKTISNALSICFLCATFQTDYKFPFPSFQLRVSWISFFPPRKSFRAFPSSSFIVLIVFHFNSYLLCAQSNKAAESNIDHSPAFNDARTFQRRSNMFPVLKLFLLYTTEYKFVML